MQGKMFTWNCSPAQFLLRKRRNERREMTPSGYSGGPPRCVKQKTISKVRDLRLTIPLSKLFSGIPSSGSAAAMGRSYGLRSTLKRHASPPGTKYSRDPAPVNQDVMEHFAIASSNCHTSHLWVSMSSTSLQFIQSASRFEKERTMRKVPSRAMSAVLGPSARPRVVINPFTHNWGH